MKHKDLGRLNAALTVLALVLFWTSAVRPLVQGDYGVVAADAAIDNILLAMPPQHSGDIGGEPDFTGEFRITQEQPYGGSGLDGIQFFAIQRVGQMDKATLSVDADLPLAKALREVSGSSVVLTIRTVEARNLQEIRR